MNAIFPGVQDSQLLLAAAVALSATGTGTAIDLGSGFAPGGGGLPLRGIVPITAIDTVHGTYTFTLQDSPDNATWRNVSPAAPATLVGAIEASGFVQQRYVGLIWTFAAVAGGPPAITIGDSYLNPLVVR
jgi:hypothetical protein